MKFAEFEKSKDPRTAVSIRIHKNIYTLIKAVAKKRKLSINQLIITAITEFLTK